MKQASLHFALLLLLLLTATTAAHAQLMRKDTTTLPHSKWEVGLNLKPIWDKSEPYNFVVRYFFREKWALRGGVGFEIDWSNDTLDVEQSQYAVPQYEQVYYLYKRQNSKRVDLKAFVGIQFEPGSNKLHWYGNIDFFYLKYKSDYNSPYGINARKTPDIIVPDFSGIQYEWKRKEGGGIYITNGFRCRLLFNLSISSEIALAAQGFKYSHQMTFDDNSVLDKETSKFTLERGWNYSVKIEPLFRVWINYHF